MQRKRTGVRPICIPKKWLLAYAILVLILFGFLFGAGKPEIAALLLGVAFCIFVVADVIAERTQGTQVGRFRKIFMVLAILAALLGILILALAGMMFG